MSGTVFYIFWDLFLPLQSKWIGSAGDFEFTLSFKLLTTVVLAEGSLGTVYARRENRQSTSRTCHTPTPPLGAPTMCAAPWAPVPLALARAQSALPSRAVRRSARCCKGQVLFLALFSSSRAKAPNEVNTTEQNSFWIHFMGHVGFLPDMAISDLPSQHRVQPYPPEAIWFLVSHS